MTLPKNDVIWLRLLKCGMKKANIKEKIQSSKVTMATYIPRDTSRYIPDHRVMCKYIATGWFYF